MIGAMPNDVNPPPEPPAYVDPISGKKYPISAPGGGLTRALRS